MDLQVIKTEPVEFRENPYQVCRLCLSEESLGDVFDEKGLDQLISDLLSITVYLEDPISQSVCAICRTKLKEFHQFRTSCKDVQTVLHSWLQSTVQHAAIKVEQSKDQSSEISNSDTNELQCEVCHKLFKTRKLQISHQKIHQPRKHICTVCGKLFARRQHLLRHMTIHPEAITSSDTIFEIKEVKPESFEDIVSVIKPSKQKRKAPKKLVKRKSDAVHKKVATQGGEEPELNKQSPPETKGNDTSEPPNETTPSGQVADGNGTNIDRNQRQCDICHKTFKQRKVMQAHRRNIHGKKKLFCPICERPFTFRHSLNRHMMVHQSVEERMRLRVDVKSIARPFKCDICEMTFICQGRLGEHHKRAHGPRNHECHICGFRFTMSIGLEKHMLRHTRDLDSKEDFRLLHQMQGKEISSNIDVAIEGELKNIKIENDCEQNVTSVRIPNTSLAKECEECQKTFKSSKSLWLHYKFTHKPKKLKCSICNVVFVSKIRLEKHIIIKHTKKVSTLQPMNCMVCNKVFLTKAKLKRHAMNHGPRKHCCSVCNKTFTSLKRLELHMRCHYDSISQHTKRRSKSKRSPHTESQLAENGIECPSSPKEVVSLFEAEEFKIEPE